MALHQCGIASVRPAVGLDLCPTFPAGIIEISYIMLYNDYIPPFNPGIFFWGGVRQEISEKYFT
jgi:hypothetical protein